MNSTYVVDSFTHEAFKGNPAGVHLSSAPLSDSRMQQIAAELNLSETAFVCVESETAGSPRYPIRFFSPKMEIPLCGHATLAAAKVFIEHAGLGRLETVTFLTAQGLELEAKNLGKQIEMTFPVYDLQEAVAREHMLSALGIGAVDYCGFNPETKILLLELSNSKTLCELTPDFRALVDSTPSINGVLVTARSEDEYDFYSRYFWPWSGSDEDPVTGGTQTFLAKYWATRLNKSRLRSFQASPRTGEMEVELTNSDTLLIRGQAVVVFEGKILV